MEITSPEIEANIETIQKQVDNYTVSQSTKSILPSLNMSSYHVYLIIPIIIFILLLTLRPAFLNDEVKEGEETVIRFSIKKLLLWSLVLGIIFDLGIFGYYYRKKKNE